MTLCNTCIHESICKIKMFTEKHMKKHNIIAPITDCASYKVSGEDAPIAQKPQKDVLSIFDEIGLGASKQAAPSSTSNVVEDGIYCSSCKRLRHENAFAGDTCSVCHKTICEECAIMVEGSILCEACF